MYEDIARARWVAAVTLPPDEDGKRRRIVRRFPSERDADAGLIKLHRELARAGGNVTTTDMTAAAWLTTWITEIAPLRLAPKTLRNWRSVVNHHLIPALGKTKLSALTPKSVRRVHEKIRAKPEVTRESTVLLAHRVLAIALRDAKREGIYHAADLPTSLVDQPRKGKSSRPPLLQDQAIAVLSALDVAGDPMAARWAAAILLGARQGEVIGLERDRVHDDHVDLSWQLQALEVEHGCGEPGADGKHRCGMVRATRCTAPTLIECRPDYEYRHLERNLFLTKPKSEAGDRIIPLVEPLRTLIHNRIAASSGGRYGLVWHREDGAPLDPRADSTAWHALLAQAGVSPRALHSARGATASMLRRAQVSHAVRIALLGHTTIASTEPYDNAEDTDKVSAMNALSQHLGVVNGLPLPPHSEDGPPRLRLVR